MTPQAGPGTPSGAAFERICVVGAGLIGGSVARRLVGLGVDVVVVDPDERTRSLAAASGLAVVESVPADRDLVVLSTPLDALPEAMDEAASRAPQAVIIDLGSVKQAPARAAVAAGLSGRYVGVHPMAGTEHTGFEHSDPDLLVGASWAVVHGAAESPLVQVVAWVLEAFEATVVVVGAAEHDRSVALVSHAPHAVAHALLAGAETSPDVAVARWLAAGSFRDGTRVAGRNAARTHNMLTENAEALSPVLDQVIAELTALRDDLTDPDALRDRLAAVVDGAAVVREPAPRFTPCESLDDVLTSLRGGHQAGAALVVRRRDGVLETSTAREQTPPGE